MYQIINYEHIYLKFCILKNNHFNFSHSKDQVSQKYNNLDETINNFNIVLTTGNQQSQWYLT